MGRVLAISSFVARGYVGLGAAVPALQALGHEVFAVPTVVLSNHYGYPHVGGFEVPAEHLASILNGLKSNGWLDSVDAILTGYMPRVVHMEIAAETIERCRHGERGSFYMCDPVLGDDSCGLYVAEEVAVAARDLLVPEAQFVTPNRFELNWLTGEEVSDPGSAAKAGRGLAAPAVVTTSVPAGNALIGNVLINKSDAALFVTQFHPSVPHGTGDLFAALLLGHLLNGEDDAGAVSRATAGVRIVVEASLGKEELKLVETIGVAATALRQPAIVP
jgi:pyridoxine kinase